MKRIVMVGGNRCFPACLAMVTEIPYESIPDFCAQPETWLQDARAWLLPRGWEIIFLHRKALKMALADLGTLAHTGTLILGGRNARGVMHSVVAHRGEILDPDIANAGIETWDDAMVLIKIPIVS